MNKKDRIIYLPPYLRSIAVFLLAEALYLPLHLWKKPANWYLVAFSAAIVFGILLLGRSFVFDTEGVTICQIIPCFRRKVPWKKLKNVEKIKYSVSSYLVLLDVDKSYPKPPFLEAKSFFFDLRYFRHMTMILIPEVWVSDGTADKVIDLWKEGSEAV